MPYTYLGRLSYLSHDAERERPVHFEWQLIRHLAPTRRCSRAIGW